MRLAPLPLLVVPVLSACGFLPGYRDCGADPTAKCDVGVDTGDTASDPDTGDTGAPEDSGDTGEIDPLELPVGAHARWERACGPADGAAMVLVVGLAEPTCEAVHAAPTLRVMVWQDVALTGTWSIGPDLAEDAFGQWQSADDVDGFASADAGSLTIAADAGGAFTATGRVEFGGLGVVLLDATPALDCTAEQPVCG